MLGVGETKTSKTWSLPSKAHDLGKEAHVNKVVREWPRQLQDAVGARRTPDAG